MGLAVHFLATLISVKATALLAFLLSCGAFLSVWLSARLLPQLDAKRRFAFMTFALALFIVMPLYDFGQREQIALIGGLPYSLLLARRAEGKGISIRVALLAGLFGAAGFALKHYFVVIPVALEIWLLLRDKKAYRLLRPETAVLAGFALLYGAAVIVLTPDFIRIIVPLVSLAYSGYQVSLVQMFDEPAQMLWIAALCCLVAYSGIARHKPNAQLMALLIGAGGFLFAYLVQSKGWQYHAIPVTGMLMIAVFTDIVLRQSIEGSSLRPLGLSAITCSFAVAMGLFFGPYFNWNAPTLDRHLEDGRPGDNLLILAADPMQGCR